MKRRTLLLGIGTAASGGAALLGTGAFSSATVNRQMEIKLADDASAFLTLRPGEANGNYTDDSGNKLRWDFGGEDSGLGLGSTYEFDDTFEVANNAPRQTPLYIWTNVDSAAFDDDALYIYNDDPDTALHSGKAVEVNSGESVSLGVFIDTSGLSDGNFTPTVEIRAADEQPGGGGDDPPTEEPPAEEDPVTDPIPSVVLDSVSSLLNESGEPITDGSDVAIYAESTATNADEDGNGDATSYPDGTDIPVVALDSDAGTGDVVGITGPFVTTDTDFATYGNEEFLLNVYDKLVGGNGTVLHDEGHGQFYTLTSNGGDDFQTFAEYVENNGYTYESTTSLESDLSGADAAVITSPSDSFTTSELDALSTFVDDGGVVFLHDQSDYNGFDATGNLNDIATGLELGFRFNDDQVIDNENNAGASFTPTTANFNSEEYPDFFRSVTGSGSN